MPGADEQHKMTRSVAQGPGQSHLGIGAKRPGLNI